LIKKISKIIQFFHNNNIIINDLKPQNIIISHKFKPKIIDFGLITIKGDKTHSLKGTPLYFPPESFLEICSFEKKDIWIFGAILFEFYVGSYPLENFIKYNKDNNNIFMDITNFNDNIKYMEILFFNKMIDKFGKNK